MTLGPFDIQNFITSLRNVGICNYKSITHENLVEVLYIIISLVNSLRLYKLDTKMIFKILLNRVS